MRSPIEAMKNHKLLVGLSCLVLMIAAGLVALLFSDLSPMIERQLKTQLPLISAWLLPGLQLSSTLLMQGGAWVFEGEAELFAHLDYSSGDHADLQEVVRVATSR